MKINKLWNWLFNPPLDGPSAIILLRLMAGGVFLWEGILKFIYVNQGVGRFTKLGLPFPQATANMVGVLEIVGGILLITGFLTRAIAIPFVIEMLVAILSTKISLYLGTSPLPLPPVPPQIGFWAVLHEIRSGIRTVDDHNVLAYCRAGAMVPGRATDPTDERGKASAT
ncbi:MAG TPA: DoxX family protein [Pyrinomonadaceae bacterium]|nr:DoxX family protein [Pyrinomonadaceae bacterium]